MSSAQDVSWRRWLKGPATLHEGPRNGKGPLSVIITGYQAQSGLARAVSSIRSQSDDVEIVVVNSGSGTVRDVLSDHLAHIRLIEIDERLFVGAARNVGISASHGRYVAFLAGDCIALPAWVTGRIEKHDAGALMVSAAVVPTRPNTFVGALVAGLVFPRRAPELDEDEALHYSRSFHRSVFTEAGYFAPGLRIGEDTEFNKRADRLAPTVWAPDVVVRHDDKRSLVVLLLDIFKQIGRAHV